MYNGTLLVLSLVRSPPKTIAEAHISHLTYSGDNTSSTDRTPLTYFHIMEDSDISSNPTIISDGDITTSLRAVHSIPFNWID